MAHRQHVNEHDTAFLFGEVWYASEGSATEAYQANRRRMRVLSLTVPPVFAAIMATLSVAMLLLDDIRDARIAAVIGFAVVIVWPGMYVIVREYVLGAMHERNIHLPEGVALRLTTEDRDRLRVASEEGIPEEAIKILEDEWATARHEESQPSREQARSIMRRTLTTRR